MMHHDGQPLASKGNLYGLLNQVNFLRKSGSVSVQVTILTPSVGSKGYEEPFEKGMVIDQAGAHNGWVTKPPVLRCRPWEGARSRRHLPHVSSRTGSPARRSHHTATARTPSNEV